MRAKAVHIIRKQQYDIAVPDQQQGRSMQHLLQNLNLQYVLPAISSKLDQMFATDEVVVIEKIEINIGVIKIDARPHEWVGKILEGLQTAVKPVLTEETAEAGDNIKKSNLSMHAIEVWLHFLQTGMLPAKTFLKSLSEVKEEILNLKEADRMFLKNELLRLFPSASALQRLATLKEGELFFVVNMFIPELSHHGWTELLERLFTSITTIAKEKGRNISDNPSFFKRQVVFFTLAEVLKIADPGNSPKVHELFNASIEKLVQLVSSPNNMDKGQNSDIESKKNESESDGMEETKIKLKDNKSAENSVAKTETPNLREEGIFINNAGVCLLAPYVPLFFKAIGLTDGGAFTDKVKQQRAIFLLHYLATGEADASEEKLVFSKLLCGWPLQMLCVLEDEITAFEMKEGSELLQSIIEHWGVLKNTSPDGLREGFLRREGKLIESDDQFLLQVEQQSIDILLEQVPWTFRMIKLPWMKKLVTVEWY